MVTKEWINLKILSIDTASSVCGVSIMENTNLICKLDCDTGTTHSENLMPMIKDAFAKCNLSLNDIDLIVCDKGPGSFTGIRIGVATAKAFCDSFSINCVGISSLEALAYNIKENGLICSLIDCKNNNCYFALYRHENDNYTELVSPTANNIDDALEMLGSFPNNIFFVGDGAVSYKDKILSKSSAYKIANGNNNVLNSYSLGLAGLHKFSTFKDINESTDILPLYLKKPQAQVQLEEKLKNINIAQMTLEDFYAIENIFSSDFDAFWSANILKEELQANSSKFLVAKYKDEVVGFAGFKVLVDEADIMNIAVKKSYRCNGIGSLLLNNLIDLFNSFHLHSLNLEVSEKNVVAIKLYKKFGFKVVSIRKNYYPDSSNAIVMKWNITLNPSKNYGSC